MKGLSLICCVPSEIRGLCVHIIYEDSIYSLRIIRPSLFCYCFGSGLDWLQTLKQFFFINVSFYIPEASLTLMALFCDMHLLVASLTLLALF